mmetsp:Transcript_28891/g.60122  ORF Transcript_28891/g.60122 Transcript_28891/m.60122 type:complete len:226 (+) Transcript_28891:1282-1959(+)
MPMKIDTCVQWRPIIYGIPIRSIVIELGAMMILSKLSLAFLVISPLFHGKEIIFYIGFLCRQPSTKGIVFALDTMILLKSGLTLLLNLLLLPAQAASEHGIISVVATDISIGVAKMVFVKSRLPIRPGTFDFYATIMTSVLRINSRLLLLPAQVAPDHNIVTFANMVIVISWFTANIRIGIGTGGAVFMESVFRSIMTLPSFVVWVHCSIGSEILVTFCLFRLEI